MANVLAELNAIKDAAEDAIAASGDPLLIAWLTGVLTGAAGYIDQLTPRAAETNVQFEQNPVEQQPLATAASATEPIGTPDAEAANADTGGAEDEPAPDPTPTSGRHSQTHRRRPND